MSSAAPKDSREDVLRALTLGGVLLCGVYIVVRPLANQFEPYTADAAFAGLVLCLLGLVCGGLLLLDRASALPSRLGLAVVLWTGLLIWGAARSPHQGRGIPFAADFAGYILLMLCGYILARRDRAIVPLLCRLLIAMAVIEGAAGVWQHFVDFPRLHATLAANKELLPEALQSSAGRTRLSGNNVFGSFGYPNSLGAYLLIGTLLLSALVVRGRALGKAAFVLLPAFVLMLLASYFTQSKGALVALLGGVFAWLTFRTNDLDPARARLWNGLAIAAVVVLVGTLALATLGHISTQPFGASLQVRFEYWRSALGMIAMDPLQGVGLAGFAEHFGFFKTLAGSEAKETHNDYLQLCVELGVIGLLAYVGTWVMLLRGRVAEAAIQIDEQRAVRLESMGIAGALVAFAFMYVSFEPLNAVDLWNLLRGETGNGVVVGAFFALAAPIVFVLIVLATRRISVGPPLAWAMKAAIAAVLLHQLIDFDLRAQAVMGAVFLLGGTLFAGSVAPIESRTKFERVGRTFPLVLALALLPFSFWIPAQAGLARATAEALEADAAELLRRQAPSEEDREKLAQIRRDIVHFRQQALDVTPFDPDAWVDLALATEAAPLDESIAARRRKVESCLREALARRPYSHVPPTLLGNFFAKNDEWHEAAKWFHRGREHYPLHPGLNVWIGDALLMCDVLDQAAEAYLHAFAIDQKINDTNVRLSAMFTDPRAGVFSHHNHEAAVFERVEQRGARAIEKTEILRGLSLRRLISLCTFYRDAERAGNFPARREMGDEIRATAERFFELQIDEGQRAHAAFYVALSYEIGFDPELAKRKKAAWERAKKLHADVKDVPSTEESLFQRMQRLYDK
ncbi:MAG TPA: O-antigen ligase family protein [Planctomycetota bacterium]|nr:O-antigen ligase family protein [Planctomycetota bacterium]